jgi:hypothetical protein
MKWSLLIITSAVLLAGACLAQQADVASLKGTSSSSLTGLGVSPASTPFSLIDLSRIKWSHSYSVAFFSGGGTSSSAGLWNTSLDYEISSKLFLSLNMGVLHNPGAIWGRTESNATFLPGFRLDYRPSNNFMMSVSVQQAAGYYDPYYSRSYLGRRYPFLTE